MDCPICGTEVGDSPPRYPNLVCNECDERAVNSEGEPAKYGNEYLGTETVVEDEDENVIQPPPETGDNPVFIDGQKCWRRYRFGGWVTMMDKHGCSSVDEFYDKHDIFC